MIAQSMMQGSRLYESANGRTREEGDLLVYHKGLNRKIWMSVVAKNVGTAKVTYWGTPHNDDNENLPNKEIELVARRGVYSTK